MLNPETFLIDDPRASKITEKKVIGVKDGVASSSIMTYKYNSNSTSSASSHRRTKRVLFVLNEYEFRT